MVDAPAVVAVEEAVEAAAVVEAVAAEAVEPAAVAVTKPASPTQ